MRDKPTTNVYGSVTVRVVTAQHIRLRAKASILCHAFTPHLIQSWAR